MTARIRFGVCNSPIAMARTKRVVHQIAQKSPDSVCIITAFESADERDQALLSGQIDSIVHDFSDLNKNRPKDLKVASVLHRGNERDVVLFPSDIIEQIREGKTIVIGTSSLRQDVLLPDFLGQALPRLCDASPTIKTISVQGDIVSQVVALKESAPNSHHYDGLALSLSDLNCLFANDDTPVAMVQSLKWMVMPLSVCPTAPGQGALCVEIHKDRHDLVETLRFLHHAKTAERVSYERNIFTCHDANDRPGLGVTHIHLPNVEGDVVLVRGKAINEDVFECRTELQPDARLWDGQEWRNGVFQTVPLSPVLPKAKAAFVTHARALPDNADASVRFWVSGTASWFRLAQKGFWVEGCADGFGFDYLRPTLEEPVLGLPPLQDWVIYTHQQGVESWPIGRPVATYRLEPHHNEAMLEALRQADAAWWSSDSQYASLSAYCGHLKFHACGAGKTAERLKAKGVAPLAVFPSHDVYKTWLKGNRR